MPDNKLKQFHESIKGNPNISGVPSDFNDFQSALRDSNKSKAFYDAISKNEAISGIPKDYNTFASSLGLVEKKNPNERPLVSSGPASSTESGKFVVPLPSNTKKKEPLSSLSELNKEVVKNLVISDINERKELKKREMQAKMSSIQLDVLSPQSKVLPNFIRSGLTSIASGLSYLPGALVDIATSNPASTAGLAPGTIGQIESPKITAKERPKEFNDAIKYFYDLGKDFKGISQDLSVAAKLSAGIKNPNIDTIEQFSQGNIIDGAKSLGVEMGQTVTQMAAMAFGGTPIIGASMVGSNLGEEVEQDGEISFVDLTQSIGKAGAELALEKFFNKDLLGSQTLVKGLGGFLTPAGQAIKQQIAEKGIDVVKKEAIQGLFGIGKKVFEGSKDEMIEETSAVAINFFIDAIDQDKFNAEGFKQLGHDMANAALIAGATGGTVSGLAAKASMQRLSREDKMNISRLEDIAKDETKSQRVRDIAVSEINNIRTGVGVAADESIDKISKLPLEKKVEAIAIKDELDSLNDDLDGSNDMIREKLEPMRAELEGKLNDLLAEPEVVSEPQTQEITTTPVSDAELANNILEQEQPSVEEIPTEQPLSEREQQMVTTPTEVPLEATMVGKVLNKIGKFIGEGKENAILKGIDKMLSTGDLNAVRAKEIVDAETGNTIDKIKSISTKIQDLVGKDKVSRELANTVMSVDRLDDKISKLAVNDNYTAISDILEGKYTPEQIKSAMTYFKDNETPGTSIMTKEVFDDIVSDVSGIGAQKIADKKSESSSKVKSLVGKILNYDTVGKTQENVAVEPVLIQGSQSPMFTGSELSTGNISPESRTKNIETTSDGPVSLIDLRAELASLPNGQQILQTLDESIANKKIAEEQLSKTAKGQKILDQAKEARNLIDSFTDWVSSSKSAAKIEQRVGEVIAGNRGSYLKRSFKYWKDKKFEPSEAMKNVALESVTEDLMVLELTQLSKSPEYNRLEGDAKRQYLTQIAEDVRRRSKITIGTYLDEIRQKRKDGNSFFPNTKSEKVNGKTIEFRKLIDESFLDLLGNINDPISQFHDTVLAQTQIKAAANFHWIINEVTGKENIFDSREQVVEFNGTSEGFKQINDPNSVLDGKWVNENIYDVISSSVPTKDGTLYHWFRVMLSTMRKTKTIYNFFAGWTTNLIGGELTLAANGVIPNPKKTGKYLLNRLKYVKNPEKLTADIQKDIDAMKDNGFWSTSVSAGTIKLLDDNYMDMTAYDRGEHVTKSATRRWIDKAKRIDDNVVRNYSVIDDFTKLVFFREKKDIFSRKLYGKKYDELTVSEKNIVHANVAERGKQNIATMSRLPRIYSKIAKYPLGDFMAFRISAIKSGLNTFENAYRDINSSFDKTLSPEQQKAYLEDGLKTVSGMLMAAAANSALYGTLATLAMGVMDDKEKDKLGVFKDKISDGVNYGSKSSLYTDFKGTPAVNPQWMRGKNNIPIKDDGNGNIELLNISNKDPYDELFGMFLPRAGTTKEETYWGILKETFSPNMTVNLLLNIRKGRDQWDRRIYTGDDTDLQKGLKISGYVLTEALVPPAIKNAAKETYKELQQSKAVEGDTKKQIKKKEVESGEYFNALLKNSPMLLNRTYKVNLIEHFGYYTEEFYEDRPEKFNDLDQDGKEKRFQDLERIRDGYNYLRRYSVLNNNPDFLDKATEQMFKSARGITENEKDYIVYGDKSYD